MEKTEVIFPTRNSILLAIDITTRDKILTMSKLVSNFDIRLDPRLTFWGQIPHATIKTPRVTSLLSGLMATIVGRIQSRRRLIVAITVSILLYSSVV